MKFLKKLVSICLVTTMVVSMSACNTNNGNENIPNNSGEKEQANINKNVEDEKFIIEYPSYFKEDMGESLVLNKKPEKIIILSSSSLQIAAKYNITPIAHSGLSSNISFPEKFKNLPVITAGMSDLDTESIIAMQPDLLIVSSHFKEKFDETFKNANIPTYYVKAGPSVAYEQVKEEAIVLSKAFGGEKGAQEVKKEFDKIESRAKEFSEKNQGLKSMILFGAPPSYQQTSKAYLGSMLSMLSVKVISDELIGVELRTAPLDFEQFVKADIDLAFAISPTMPTSEAIKNAYEKEFTKNSEVWNNIKVVQEDKVIYLSNEYVLASGIHVIDSINNLIDLLEAKLNN